MSKTVTKSQLDRILAAKMAVAHSPPANRLAKATGADNLTPMVNKPSQLPTDVSQQIPITVIGTTYAEVVKSSIISTSSNQFVSKDEQGSFAASLQSKDGQESFAASLQSKEKEIEKTEVPSINVQRASSVNNILADTKSDTSVSFLPREKLSQAPTSLLTSIAGERYRKSEKHIEDLARKANDSNIVIKYRKFRSDMSHKVSGKRRSYNSAILTLKNALTNSNATDTDVKKLYNTVIDKYKDLRKEKT